MKKIIITLTAIALSMAFLTGCANSEKSPDEGKHNDQNVPSVTGFYTLQEAYDYGYLTQDDLKSVAYYVNNGETHSELTEEYVADSIKESAAKRMRERKIEPNKEARAEGFTIVAYYGKYSGYYVVKMRNVYDLHPEDVPNDWVEIGGVDFHFTGYDTIGCSKVN